MLQQLLYSTPCAVCKKTSSLQMLILYLTTNHYRYFVGSHLVMFDSKMCVCVFFFRHMLFVLPLAVIINSAMPPTRAMTAIHRVSLALKAAQTARRVALRIASFCTLMWRLAHKNACLTAPQQLLRTMTMLRVICAVKNSAIVPMISAAHRLQQTHML